MVNTPHFELPLISPSQAQKHVTVNDALSRVDALMQLRLISATTSTPPATSQEGDTYGVASGAVNEWAGQEGTLAIFANGGWAFVPATLGMRAFIADQNGWAGFDGTQWTIGLQTLTPNGAGMQARAIEIDHVISAGATSAVSYALPGQSVVYGVTGRVISAISGTLTGFSLGVASSTNRYGSGLSGAQGAWLRGLSGTPITYYAPEDLVLTAEGGEFGGGTIRLVIHAAQFSLPSE